MNCSHPLPRTASAPTAAAAAATAGSRATPGRSSMGFRARSCFLVGARSAVLGSAAPASKQYCGLQFLAGRTWGRRARTVRCATRVRSRRPCRVGVPGHGWHPRPLLRLFMFTLPLQVLVYPYEQRPLEPRENTSDRGQQKPHPRGLCQMCQHLGAACWQLDRFRRRTFVRG